MRGSQFIQTERKLANISSCTNQPMRDGDFGDDSRFTDVQMLTEFRCADHG